VDLGLLEGVERLHEHLPDAGVAPGPQDLLGRLDVLLVQIPREGRARVVGQDAREHDGVVLVRRLGPEVAVEVFAEDARALGRRRR